MIEEKSRFCEALIKVTVLGCNWDFVQYRDEKRSFTGSKASIFNK
jgi:hypothetical protein